MRARLAVGTGTTVALIAAVIAFGCRDSGVADSGPAARLDEVQSWAFALGDPLEDPSSVAARFGSYDLVVIDGEEASRATVAALQDDGAIVLGYLSVGSIEEGRSWSDAAAPYRLDRWEEWGEWYADVSRPELRSMLVDDVAPAMLRKGFDGLFLDNVDMVVGHPEQAAGMEQLVSSLSSLVRGGGGLLFAQNGPEVIDPYLPLLDGWNLEDVSATYSFATDTYEAVPQQTTSAATAALRKVADSGLFVTATDYVAAGDHELAAAAVANACAAGALPFVADIGLTTVPEEPLTC